MMQFICRTETVTARNYHYFRGENLLCESKFDYIYKYISSYGKTGEIKYHHAASFSNTRILHHH